ncbi:transposase [Streptomyces sp. SGAir0957]
MEARPAGPEMPQLMRATEMRRKRHVVVDLLGWPLFIMVTPADVHDSVAAREVLFRLPLLHPEITVVPADLAYASILATWASLRPGQPSCSSSPARQLATELLAAVLARTLGIDTNVAVTWQRAAAGDWASYAAVSAAMSWRINEATHHHPSSTPRIRRVQGHPTRSAPGSRRADRSRPAPGHLPRSGHSPAYRRAMDTRRLVTAFSGPPADAGEPGSLPRAPGRRHTAA